MERTFIVRAGRPDDAALMAAIFNYYVTNSDVIFSNTLLSGDDMNEKLQRLDVGGRFPFLIAEVDGHVAGYAYAHHWQPDPVYDRTWELTMYLDNTFRGMGIGSTLMDRLIEECRQRGAHTLVSCITEGNQACERMCSRSGFTRCGSLPETGFKFGQYLNDVLYYRVLDR